LKKRHKQIVDVDTELKQAKEEWTESYNQLSDACLKFNEVRERASALISFCEQFVNSISNHPQSFDKKFEQSFVDKIEHIDPSVYVGEERKALIEAGAVGAAGILAGAVVFKRSKILGAIIATASGVISFFFGWWKKYKIRKEKLAEIKAIKDEMCVFQKKVALLNTKAEKCESFYYKLSGSLDNCARLEGMDYKKLSIIERTKLGTLINNVHSLSVVVKESI